jgi:transcriptional regulator with XRE-family HTH domain
MTVMNVRGVGEYIRTQRRNAKLSLSKVSGLAGVSIPYLSQVERGLRKPSADILQAIAKGLRISAETLYVQAGMLEARAVPDVPTSVLADPSITERQKQALIQIYEAFRDDAGRVVEQVAAVIEAETSTNGSGTLEPEALTKVVRKAGTSKASAPPRKTTKRGARP